MNLTELILVSTTATAAPPNTYKLLKATSDEAACGEGIEFGNNFFPIIAVLENGSVQHICSQDDFSESALLIIISDEQDIDNSLLDYLITRLNGLKRFYAVLHKGEGSKHDTHENTLLNFWGNYLEKISIAKDHHTSNNPLGDALEKVSQAVLENPINVKLLEEGLMYLKTKTTFFHPLKEAHSRIWKKMKLTSVKSLGKNVQDKIRLLEESKAELINSTKINTIKEELENWSVDNFHEKMDGLLATLNNYK